MRTYVRAIVKDRAGRVLKDTGWKETNTLTKNFYAFLGCAMKEENTPCTRVDGTAGTIERPVGGTHAFMELFGYEGNDDGGLLVGTGTTEPTRDDYALESKIPHGTGAGQLYYYTTSIIHGPDYVEVRRTFANQSGADITVREVGLVACYYDVDVSAYRYALIARSLFTITIPDGGSATLYYKISG
ncbi:MAG: hypothetical protein DRP01_02525 [Archaeoglobales archaeon]|nr:MAG: hypothetical protein DRP01_02525 [Archaeoglobales archaeon]